MGGFIGGVFLGQPSGGAKAADPTEVTSTVVKTVTRKAPGGSTPSDREPASEAGSTSVDLAAGYSVTFLTGPAKVEPDATAYDVAFSAGLGPESLESTARLAKLDGELSKAACVDNTRYAEGAVEVRVGDTWCLKRDDEVGAVIVKDLIYGASTYVVLDLITWR